MFGGAAAGPGAGRRRTGVSLAAVVLAATGLVAPPALAAVPAGAERTSAFCTLTGFDSAHTFTWTGPSSGSWFDPANWNNGAGPARVPGNAPGNPGSDDPTPALNATNSDYVCIGGRAHVTIPSGRHVGLSVLDLGENATLRVTHGSMLYVNARHHGRVSHVRAGSRLTFSASTLGGQGILAVTGVLDMTTWHNFVSTQVSRWCDLTPCANTATEPGGRTVITAPGEMDVDGVDGGGVAIEGRRTVQNAGIIALTNHGFLAPDDGTVIDNQAGGVIRIGNDRGIYEGVVNPSVPLPVLRNAGRIVKTGGSGAAVIGARYEGVAGGRIEVRMGSLSLAGGGSIPEAFVEPGASYGNTACTQTTCTATQTSSAHPLAALVRLPASSHASPVSIVLNRPTPGSNAFGGPVSIRVPNATSTRTHPTRLNLRYDDSVVPDHPGTIRVYRLGRHQTRIFVPRCTSSGDVPKGRSACVVRAGCRGANRADARQVCGGVDVVVNTYQPASRWIAT